MRKIQWLTQTTMKSRIYQWYLYNN